jgi:hypothetical protein
VKKLIVCVLLAIVGCKDQRPAAPTAEQSRQLNDAEEMLNSMGNNEEGPADRSASPSNQSD